MSDDHDVIVDDDDDAVDEKLKILKLSSHDFTVERRWQKLKIWFAKQVTETTKEVKQSEYDDFMMTTISLNNNNNNNDRLGDKCILWRDAGGGGTKDDAQGDPMMINDDQLWSMVINDDQWWSMMLQW